MSKRGNTKKWRRWYEAADQRQHPGASGLHTVPDQGPQAGPAVDELRPVPAVRVVDEITELIEFCREHDIIDMDLADTVEKLKLMEAEKINGDLEEQLAYLVARAGVEKTRELLEGIAANSPTLPF